MATYTDIVTFRRDFWDVTDEEISSRILNRAAEIAYNKINSYLSGIYSVPFGTAPDRIVDISDMLTKGYAIALAAKGNIDIPEIEMLKLAADELKDVIRGTAELIGATRLSTRGAVHTMDEHGHIFDLDDSVFHGPDSDYIDEVGDMRSDM